MKALNLIFSILWTISTILFFFFVLSDNHNCMSISIIAMLVLFWAMYITQRKPTNKKFD